jgi:hypothetical protein
MLDDEDFATATDPIPSGLSRAETAELRDKKQAASAALMARYASADLPAGDVERVLHSVADSRTYQAIACRPIQAMINYLTMCFSSSDPGEQSQSLDIRYGQGGSMLSHGHSTQYVQYPALLSCVCGGGGGGGGGGAGGRGGGGG